MGKTVEFHPAAMEESEAAREWYAERSLIAAKAFVSELNHAVDRITETPERWPYYLGDTRRYIFPRFPFSLIYRIIDDKIQIIAIAHGKRKPGYWEDR